MQKIVVGGGPIGTYLSSKSPETTIFEQKRQIGRPVQCTGLLSNQAKQLVDTKLLKTITLNTITSAEIIGPHTKTIFSLKPNYIINNSLFEKRLADKALTIGNEILLNRRYEGSRGLKHQFKDLKTKKKQVIESKELIGVDGPASKVRQAHNFAKQNHYVGLQARIKVKAHENSIKFYPHLGVYAWYVPETEHTARAGIALKKANQTTANTFFKRFPGKILERQGGIIPLHKPCTRTWKQTRTHKVILLGDAAGHIKNTTGGGLVPGMIATNHYISKKDTYKGSPRSLKKELYSHFLVHNLLSRANQKEWDKIILESQKHTKLLEQVNRDQTRKMLIKLGSNKTFLTYGLSKILTGKVRLF